MLERIRAKVEEGEPIMPEEGFFLLREAPLPALSPLAQIVRFRHNPQPVVTFAIDTNLNYTNICDACCLFCAFWRHEKSPDAYTYTVEGVIERIRKAAECGVTTVLLQGGLNPHLHFEYYLKLVRETRKMFPQIHPHYFSAPEIHKMSQVSGLPTYDVLLKLKEAGLETLPGGGAEILSDRVRQKISPRFPKGRSSDWLEVHRQAHKLGYRTTATMTYGHIETDEDVIEHLEKIRSLQSETGGFTAFIPWSLKLKNTALEGKVEEAGPNRYLRIIATSRIYLHNFKHIQASWFSEGKRTGQIALHFGADDFGGTLLEEEVMKCAGFYNRASVDEVISLIQEAGFIPAQRTTLYEVIRYFKPRMSRGGIDEIKPRSKAS